MTILPDDAIVLSTNRINTTEHNLHLFVRRLTSGGAADLSFGTAGTTEVRVTNGPVTPPFFVDVRVGRILVRIFVGQYPYDPAIDYRRTDIIYDVTIPAGAYDRASKAGWKPSGTGWSYKNAAGVLGITAVKLKPGKNPLGSVTVKVKGKNLALLPDGAVPVVAYVQLRSTPSTQCGKWESMTCPPAIGQIKCQRK